MKLNTSKKKFIYLTNILVGSLSHIVMKVNTSKTLERKLIKMTTNQNMFSISVVLHLFLVYQFFFLDFKKLQFLLVRVFSTCEGHLQH